METHASERQSARSRLLAAANDLFYREGIHTVGIDRVIEHAGVAKASLYNAFGSKDELVRAYLEARFEASRNRIEKALLERHVSPRERIVGIFDAVGANFANPEFRGCAFINASAESEPGSVAREVTGEYRRWMRGMFTDLARDLGVADPERLGGQLVVLYSGAAASAGIDHDPSISTTVREIAATLVDAAIADAAAAAAAAAGIA